MPSIRVPINSEMAGSASATEKAGTDHETDLEWSDDADHLNEPIPFTGLEGDSSSHVDVSIRHWDGMLQQYVPSQMVLTTLPSEKPQVVKGSDDGQNWDDAVVEVD